MTNSTQPPAPLPETGGRMRIRTRGHVRFIDATSIGWVEAADNYSVLHCGPEKHVVRETISSLAERLDGALFARIHRSAIVNLGQVARLQPWFRGDYHLWLRDGTELTLSRTYRAKVPDLMSKPLERHSISAR